MLDIVSNLEELRHAGLTKSVSSLASKVYLNEVEAKPVFMLLGQLKEKLALLGEEIG